MDPLDESLARRALRKAAMTDRPVADREPLSANPLHDRWHHVGRPWSTSPGLIYAGSEDPHAGTFICDTGSWSDETYFGERPILAAGEIADLIVAHLLATLDAARSHPDEAGLRALGHNPTSDGRCEHRWRNRTTRAVRCPFLDGWRAALAQPAVPVAGAETPWAADDDGDHSAFTHRDDDEDPPLRAAQPEDDGLRMREAYRRGWLEATSRSSEPSAQPEDDGLARSTAPATGPGLDAAAAAVVYVWDHPEEALSGGRAELNVAMDTLRAATEARSGVDDVGELREAAEAVDKAWFSREDGERIHFRYASDFPAELARLRAALATTQPERRDP